MIYIYDEHFCQECLATNQYIKPHKYKLIMRNHDKFIAYFGYCGRPSHGIIINSQWKDLGTFEKPDQSIANLYALL